MRATALCIIPRGRANATRSRRVVCCLPLCTAFAGVGGRRAEAWALQDKELGEARESKRVLVEEKGRLVAQALRPALVAAAIQERGGGAWNP